MKYLSLCCLFILSSFCSFGQSEASKFKQKQLNTKYLIKTEFKDRLIKYDFTKLLTQTDNSVVYGFIGENYQRLRIKLISVKKDSILPDTYHVYGKSMIKGNIDEFEGTIKISNIRKFSPLLHGCEDEDKYKGYKGEFILLGDFDLPENPKQNHSGTFKGVFKSDFFIDKNNRMRYNDIEFCSDGYTNNQFVGQWIAYKDNTTKRCNWGDYRIPNSGDLDGGAGEFSPMKHTENGWQNFTDKKIENAKWWE